MESIDAPCGAPVSIFEDPASLTETFARTLTQAIGRRLIEAPFYHLALTGGSTPEPIYRRLGERPFVEAVDWRRVNIFFGDERCVPPDHGESNYRMAWEAWLKNGPVPRERIHRLEGEAADPGAAAERYAAALRREAPGGPDGFPRLDLILLGMGGDGHVASLFPGTAALRETRAAVVANPVARLNATRLTLTLPTINAASAVWLLVTGEAKAERAAQALGWLPGGEALPVGQVRPAGGAARWWLDRAAAGRIPRE